MVLKFASHIPQNISKPNCNWMKKWENIKALRIALNKQLRKKAQRVCTEVFQYSLWVPFPKSAVRFGAFEKFKTMRADEKGNLKPVDRMLCGLGAGVCEAILAVTPMETVKVKFINDQRSANPQYKGLFHGVRSIIAEQGLMGCYQGLSATILKQGSNQAIRFFVMESLKDWYRSGDPDKKVPKLIVGLMGGFAGACSVFGNTPIDVVKTRMQGIEAKRYKNTLDCARQIMVNEGPKAFYKGTVPRLSRVVLDVGITFMIYDSIMEAINHFWSDKKRQ